MSMPESDFATPDLRVSYDETVPVLSVPADMGFETLRSWIRGQMPSVQGEIGGRAVRLDLGERDIELFDVRRLLHLLRDEFQVEVTGLYVHQASIHRYAERELKLKLFIRSDDEPVIEVEDDGEDDDVLPGLAEALAAIEDAQKAASDEEDVDEADEPTEETPVSLSEEAPAAFEPAFAQRRPIPLPDLPKEEEPDVDEHGGKRVLAVHRTLRSGASVRYDGDIHIYGDVNAGAQVRAGGDVVVLGRLRGVVHAGAQGKEDAFILAFDLSPTQLRIAGHIAIAPSRPAADHFVPEIAQVRDEHIVIEPYKGRLVRR